MLSKALELGYSTSDLLEAGFSLGDIQEAEARAKERVEEGEAPR